MEALIACAGLLAVGAITPGPNNLAVLRIAVAHGRRSALPAMAGIVLGGLAMLGLAQIGLVGLLDRYTWLQRAITLCGAAYLIWLGLALVWQSFRPALSPKHSDARAPDGLLALFVFQFTNPKSWTLALTVSAALRAATERAGRISATALLFALFVAIPSVCLIAWAAFGRVVEPLLRNATTRVRFDRAMGLLLAASAVALLTHY